MRAPTLGWEVEGESSIRHLHTDRKRSVVLPKMIFFSLELNWLHPGMIRLWAQLSQWCQWCSRQLWRSMRWKASAEASRRRCSARVSLTWPLSLLRAGKILSEERCFFLSSLFHCVWGEEKNHLLCSQTQTLISRVPWNSLSPSHPAGLHGFLVTRMKQGQIC